MNDINVRLSKDRPDTPPVIHPPIGRILLNRGHIDDRDLHHALKLQRRIDAPLGDIMVAEGLVRKRDVLGALATQAQAEGANLELEPPGPEMAQALSSDLCLKYGVVPWRMDKRALYVATSSPRRFADLLIDLGDDAPTMFPVIVDEHQIQKHQSHLYGEQLAIEATQKVPEAESCRVWEGHSARRRAWAFGSLGCLAAALLLTPHWTLMTLCFVAVATLVLMTILKAATLVVYLRQSPHRQPAIQAPFRMPRVSVLVPLLREREIAQQLITRLSQLTYPKSLLNVVLVMEEDDHLTRDTIARTELPDWITTIEVPKAGGLTTKPRALNYALDFCTGSIVGVWDAEDWPEPDQIERVVSRFHHAPDNVVCLQGILDYYNARSSWLARCFTIEYAMWWRVVMPGVERLGLVVPLGGTTLFFKRDALESIGRWDAHNVTEDADLGVRLARKGYKTELLHTVTREEATSRPWAWIRQRSRWLKGFLVTYLVHMRSPRTLLSELGLWRFMGLQTLFLCAFLQFALAPLLWSFWLALAGFHHPVAQIAGDATALALITTFITAEAISLVLGCVAVSRRAHIHLLPFVPSMIVYFTLGTVAAYKALWELIQAPFFWDKTQHGVTLQPDDVRQGSAVKTPGEP